MAVIEIVCGLRAEIARSQDLFFFAVFHTKSRVEDVERPFPQTFVAVLLGIANNSAFNLVHLLEATVLHDCREDFATNSARAIRNNRFSLEVVVLSTFKFANKIWCDASVRNNSVLKSTDPRFEGISSIKEHHVVATFFHQGVHFARAEMSAATNDAVFIYFYFFRNPERDNLVANTNAESWEIIAEPLAPFEVDVLESFKLACLAYIQLHVHEAPTNGAVDAIFGNDDAALEIQLFAQGALPQPNGNGIGQWSEFVEQNNLVFDALQTICFSNLALKSQYWQPLWKW